MGYAIVCDARKGAALQITTLALVDRKKSKKFWWTSDSPELALNYKKFSAAQFAARRLKKNRVRVVDFQDACKILEEQADSILAHKLGDGVDPREWDGHKGL